MTEEQRRAILLRRKRLAQKKQAAEAGSQEKPARPASQKAGGERAGRPPLRKRRLKSRAKASESPPPADARRASKPRRRPAEDGPPPGKTRRPVRGKRPAPSGRRPRRDREEVAAEPGSKKKLYIIGGAALLVVAVLVGFLLMPGDKTKTPPKDQSKPEQKQTVAKTDPADAAKKAEREREKAIRKAQLLEMFKRCADEESEKPRAYTYLEMLYYRLISDCGGFPMLKQRAEQCLKRVQDTHVSEGKATLEALQEEIESIENRIADEGLEDGYQVALKLFESMPPEIKGVGKYEDIYETLKTDITKKADKEKLLSQLEKEAMAYAKKGLVDVAEAIIRNGFSSQEFDESSKLWQRREKLLQKYKTSELAAWMKKEKDAEDKRRAAAQKKHEEELAQRRDAFLASKKNDTPEPLLGPYDLINWPMRSRGRDWQLDDENGQGVLTAKPKSGGGNWFLGQNGPDWMDYSLSFKVQVLSGTMEFHPRVPASFARRVRGRGGASTDIADFEKKLTLGADTHGTEWVSVTVDVYGGGDETVVEMTVTGGQKEGTQTFKGKDLKPQDVDMTYPDIGSFIMVMCEGSEIKLKDVNLILASRRRKGILD